MPSSRSASRPATQKRLFARYLEDLPAGELSWIGLRPERRAEVVEVGDAVCLHHPQASLF